MEKTAFFYSIFSDDDISRSIMYVVNFVNSMKKYVVSKLWEKEIYIVLHTDDFTLDIIKKVMEQEELPMDKIIIRKHKRNLYLRGTIWRFDAFLDKQYDICVIAEGDLDITYYEKRLEHLMDHKEYAYVLYATRQFGRTKRPFNCGITFIRPKKIGVMDAYNMKLCFDLIDNMEHVSYGVDEYVLEKISRHILNKYKGLIIIHEKLSNIYKRIEDSLKEERVLKGHFKHSVIADSKTLYPLISKYKSNLFLKTEPLKYKEEKSYTLDGKKYEFKELLRVEINSFCDFYLPKIFEKILL